MSFYYKRTAIEDIQRATAYIRSTFQNEESARLVAAFLTGKITRLNDALQHLDGGMDDRVRALIDSLGLATPCRVLPVPGFLIFYRLRSPDGIEILRVLENTPDYTHALF